MSAALRLAAAALALAAHTAGAAPVYSDGSMSPAQFSATPTYASPGVTVNTSVVAGPTGDALLASTGPLTGFASYAFVAGYVYDAFRWNPGSDGRLQSLDFSIDRAALVTAGGAEVSGLTLTGRALIEQDGRYYMSVSPAVTPAALPAYTSIGSSGLVAADFGLFDVATGAIDFLQNPDFDGPAMKFGFAMRLSFAFFDPASTGVPVELSAWADNLRIGLNAVPEPSPLALLAAALLALGLTRRAGTAAR
jgi:hypothetical protein